MTTEFDDDQLSAFLDGELDADTQGSLERALAADPALRARLERLHSADMAIRNELREPFDVVPERFANMLREDADTPASVVIPLRRRVAPPQAWRLPIAAGLALAVGAAGGFFASGANRGASETAFLSIGAGSEMAALLDSTPSARTVSLNDSSRLTAVVSYRAADGRLCREFDVASAQAAARAVACKSESGWRVEVAAATLVRGSGDGGYAPVAGGDHPAIDATLDRLGVADPLSPEDEAAATRRGWRD